MNGDENVFKPSHRVTLGGTSAIRINS